MRRLEVNVHQGTVSFSLNLAPQGTCRHALQAYPHQSLWSLAAVAKSSVPARRAAASAIANAAKKNMDQKMFGEELHEGRGHRTEQSSTSPSCRGHQMVPLNSTRSLRCNPGEPHLSCLRLQPR